MEKQLEKALKDLHRGQIDASLLALTASEHLFALKAVLFALDSRAEEIFRQNWEAQHSNNQKQREDLESLLLMLAATDQTFPN